MSLHPANATALLLFVVPLAALVLFFIAAVLIGALRWATHIQIPQRRRVVRAFPVAVTLALLATACGALLLARQHADSSALRLANAVVLSALYMELTFSVMYLLGVVTNLATQHPVMFLLYCILITMILIAAALVAIVASFKTMPLLLSPILYLVLTMLTLPVISFSFLLSMDRSEVSTAPQIQVVAYPRWSIEKPELFDDSTDESSVHPTSVPRRLIPATRKVAVSVLYGQISASVHFAFAIAYLVLNPDQPDAISPSNTSALALQISRSAFLVVWIICTMTAYLQLYAKSTNARTSRSFARASTAASISEAATITAFTDMPPRSSQRGPRIKFMSIDTSASRSSSFSSPRPRRNPLSIVPPMPPVAAGDDDFRDLEDPFAFVRSSVRDSQVSRDSTAVDHNEPRPTRMSAWGTLPVTPPPPVAFTFHRLPSLRALALRRNQSQHSGNTLDADVVTIASKTTTTTTSKSAKASKRRSLSIFTGYTSPSEYSQVGEGDPGFDLEEALLAQQLLQRLDAANRNGAGNSSGAGAGAGGSRRWPRRG
ncbi:hypothetical protein HMN09_00753900 [Mycena chlorophos]|uniref:Uncharacterized protein n=1 Tax=Mycena chlorophos TaxID=658473 RepID=A0A8H6WB46_MYCCL|nr:hypothetical protein HMN09_00753900 [Mycena chlorophos]